MAQDSVLRRTDAKAFFANERTYLHWMNVSVTIGSLSAALGGLAGHAHKNWGTDYEEQAVATRITALVMMATSIGMACYALFLFKSRGFLLEKKLDGPYQNVVLPMVTAVVLAVSLMLAMASACINLSKNKSP